MSFLRPTSEEKIITAVVTDRRRRTEISKRIHWLTREQFSFVKSTDDGWSRLYWDAHDGRYWELTYPHSEMHGGGPAQIEEVTPEYASLRYGVTSQ
ncbi:MAG: Imm27 family immunity protein [Pseudomonadota bacterium]|nr:Imm27 family immunity protein [Pseudomonadota bacterium]